MKLHHKKPCKDCPWKKDSLQGWLGGHDPYYYADAIQENEISACHNRDHGPESDVTAFCVGALATSKKQCIGSYKSPGSDQAKKEIDGIDDCFNTVYEFFEYHTGEKYQSRLMRMIEGGNNNE